MKIQSSINLEPWARLVLLGYGSLTLGFLAAFALLAERGDLELEIVLLSMVALLPGSLLALSAGKRFAISPGIELSPRCWNVLITLIVGIFSFAWILMTIFYVVGVSFIVHASLQASALLAFLIGGSAVRSSIERHMASKADHKLAVNTPV